MAQSHRLRLWFVLALAVVLVAAAALWLRDTLTESNRHSPLPTPSGISPLPTPIPPGGAATPPPSWVSAGAALLWAALGIVLALGVVFLILRRNRHDV